MDGFRDGTIFGVNMLPSTITALYRYASLHMQSPARRSSCNFTHTVNSCTLKMEAERAAEAVGMAQFGLWSRCSPPSDL